MRALEESELDKIRVAVVGGGYSGVELACKLADRLGDRGRFRLIELADKILRTSPNFNREAAEKALEEKGVFIDLETKVESIAADTITLEYKQQKDTIPVDLVIWTVGTQVPSAVKSLPFKQNQRGQIITEATLQVIDYPEIFALGDLADSRDADGQQVPATAQVALQQADYAAWNIWASLNNRPLLPLRYQHLGEMMALGVNNATLTGLGIKLDGTMAHIARRVAYLYRLPTFEHQLKVGFSWLTRPIIDLVSNTAGN
jgi:demethylphylloquinone reductase